MPANCRIKLSVVVALCVIGAAPAAAQRTQSAEDCKLPGGCGASDKPGGVERAPDQMLPPTRGITKPRPPEAPGAAPAPVMVAPQPPPPPPAAAPQPPPSPAQPPSGAAPAPSPAPATPVPAPAPK